MFLLLAKPIFAQRAYITWAGSSELHGRRRAEGVTCKGQWHIPLEKVSVWLWDIGADLLMIYFYDHRALSGTVTADLLMIFFTWSLNIVRDYWSIYTHDIFMITEHRQGLLEQIYSWHFHDHWALSGIIGADLLMTFSWSLSVVRRTAASLRVWSHGVLCAGLPYMCLPARWRPQPCDRWLRLSPGPGAPYSSGFHILCWLGWLHCLLLTWGLHCLLLTWVIGLPVVDMADRTDSCWHGWLDRLLLT